MKLSDLRKKYPHIKARDKKTFLTRLKESEGLGDTIEAITEATGIKKAVEWAFNGKDCGCDERKKKLNEIFRYKPNCLVKSEYDYLTEYFKRHNPKSFSKEDVFTIVRMYTRIFRVRPRICTNCPSGVQTMNQLVKDLKTLYKEYDI